MKCKDITMEKIGESFEAVNLKDAAILGALGNARTYYQYEKMYKDFAAGRCPFCHPETWRNPEIMRVGKWILKFNDMPYPNCRNHLVIVFSDHLTDPSKLTRKDGADFFEIVAKAEKKFGIKGCGVVIRRGEIAYTAGTITHIHAHIMEVQLDANGLPVGELKAYFAKSRKELLEFRNKVELFERVRKGNITGVHKGLAVFSGGSYLTETHTWVPLDNPNKTCILEIPTETIRLICRNNATVDIFEVMHSTETGIVLIDGPIKLCEYKK